jgi:hypothetical protein
MADNEAMKEALFESEMIFLRQKKNLYQKGSKEREELETEIHIREEEHRFQLEQSWLERLSQYREEAGLMDYRRLQEIEMKGFESFYGALVTAGKMTQAEYDAIVEHIKRKYAELSVEQIANNDIRGKASKTLDTAKKTAGTEQASAGSDAATGIFSISQAVENQKLINEQLKLLYGADYENNREYQEAKRQLGLRPTR